MHAAVRTMRSSVAARQRRLQQLERQLGQFDVGRRLAGIRTRLVTAEGRLSGAIARRRHRAATQLGNCAGRLDTLSPLAVLGRGYAVCWTADRARIVRDAASVLVGDSVRVTLARGELSCEIRDKSAPAAETAFDSRNGEDR
jgi:exodeoxyribonuclease VII large subunit